MSQSPPCVSPLPFPYSGANKRKKQTSLLFPPGVKLPHRLFRLSSHPFPTAAPIQSFPAFPHRKCFPGSQSTPPRQSIPPKVKSFLNAKALSLRLPEEQTKQLSREHVEQPLVILNRNNTTGSQFSLCRPGIIAFQI